jgi:hypothetical protein
MFLSCVTVHYCNSKVSLSLSPSYTSQTLQGNERQKERESEEERKKTPTKTVSSCNTIETVSHPTTTTVLRY